jgi:tight adherence protein C
MSAPVLMASAAAFVMLTVIPALWLVRETRRQQRFAARVTLISGAPVVRRRSSGWDSFRGTLTRMTSAMGQAILHSGILPSRTLSELKQTLEAAGLHGSQKIAVFVGAKIMLALGLPTLTLLIDRRLPLSPRLGTLLPLFAVIIGMILPDQVISWARKRYLNRLLQGLPDMLDMMVICAQAGLGIGPTIVRVATELQQTHPEIAMELEKTATELQVLSDSRAAIRNLGVRTGLDPLKRLGVTLTQAMQYGTPLSDALRVLAAELRQQMLNRFEARAARLPVLLTIPTALFILPCVFIVAGGSAIIQVMRSFNH